MTTPRFIVSLLMLAAVASPLRAQAQPADSMAALGAKTDLNDEDRAQIRTFVTERVAKIAGTDAGAARAATDELRTAFAGSDAFLRNYAAACLEAVGSAYKKADTVAATRLLAVIDAFNVIEAQALLLEALQDDRVGVRAAGAIGLRTLRPKLAAAGADTVQKVLGALREAGKKEKSRDTLKTIYAALNFAELPSAPEPKANVAAVLDLLDARSRQYAAGTVTALGADDTGLRIAQALLRNMDDAERQRLTVAVATMMKYAIEEYASPATKLSDVRDKTSSRELIETRNALERLIVGGEELLAALLKPEKAPTVAEQLKKLKMANMKVEWQNWVPLLQKAVNQDFALRELPTAADESAPEPTPETEEPAPAETP